MKLDRQPYTLIYMNEAKSRRKRPADVIGNAVFVMKIATGELEDLPAPSEKDPIAVELGRRGGKKGGRARMDGLSQDERKALALKAAKARWAKKN